MRLRREPAPLFDHHPPRPGQNAAEARQRDGGESDEQLGEAWTQLRRRCWRQRGRGWRRFGRARNRCGVHEFCLAPARGRGQTLCRRSEPLDQITGAALISLPLSGHHGRGRIWCWLAPVANDPNRKWSVHRSSRAASYSITLSARDAARQKRPRRGGAQPRNEERNRRRLIFVATGPTQQRSNLPQDATRRIEAIFGSVMMYYSRRWYWSDGRSSQHARRGSPVH